MTATGAQGDRLSQARLGAVRGGTAVPAYDRSALVPGVVHFGPGAFHRAHQAAYFDALLARDPRWAISGVSLHSTSVAEALRPQDGLYTLALLDRERRFRIIGSMAELLTPNDAEQIAARLVAPTTRLVTLTVTEKGYCLGPDGTLDFSHPDIAGARPDQAPKSVIEWIVRGLSARQIEGTSGLTVISCDNLSGNGQKLRGAVLAFAGAQDPALADWIGQECRFPDTMVDSITPATDDALRTLVAEETGLADQWPIQREAFTQWVIADDFAGERPALDEVGVTFTNDVAGYEAAKLRLLNGPHSTLAYVGLALGLESVADAMADGDLAPFIERLMREDIAPHVPAPAGLDLPAYIGAILDRFRNPAIRHLLSQIAWDGSQKLPQRLLDTIAKALGQERPIDRLAVPIAAWLRFIEKKAQDGTAFTDPLADRLIAGMREGGPQAILAMPEIFGSALRGNAAFEGPVLRAHAAMTDARGTRSLLAS